MALDAPGGQVCDHRAMAGRRVTATDRARSAVAIGLTIGVLFAACGPATPTASPSGGPAATRTSSPAPTSAGPTPSPEPPAVVYARIERQVEALRGLTAKVPVDPVLLDEPTIAAAVRADFDRDTPAALLASTERAQRALGLIPPDASLRDLELELLTQQVIGFYDPRTKRMSVKSTTGALGVLEQITFAHEFDHALQDQHFDLTRLGTSVADQGDRSLARLSVAEGDATLLMTDWASTALTPLQLLQYLQQSNAGDQQAELDKLPESLRAQLFFPYTSGLAFVQRAYAQGGWPAVDAIYAHPPDSTEQILHPEKYAAGERPMTVSVPADLAKRLGGGWKVELQDTFGEFGLQTWLKAAGGLDAQAAADAAAGWGGDRVVLASHGDAFAIAIETSWDTAADAQAFAAAAETTRARLAGRTALIDPGSTNRVTVFVATDDAAISRLAAALGLAG